MRKWLCILLCMNVCFQNTPVLARNLLPFSGEKQEAAILQIMPENTDGTKEENLTGMEVLLVKSETPAPKQTIDPAPAGYAENTLSNRFTDQERKLIAPDVQEFQALTAEPSADSSDEITLSSDNSESEETDEGQTGSIASYRNQLSGNALPMYDAMLPALQNGNPKSFIVGLSETFSETCGYTVVNGYAQPNDPNILTRLLARVESDCISAQSAFFYDHPEIFWVNSLSFGCDEHCFSTALDYDRQTITYALHSVQFIIDNELWSGASNKIQAFNSSVSNVKKEIQKSISSSMTAAEKARVIHDYICDHADYDNEALKTDDPQAHSAYGFFCGSKMARIVCEGYTKAYKILCDAFDVPCALGAGSAINSKGSTESHMWNYVKADGGWYLVDVTWDDQESGISSVYFLAGSSTKGFSGITVGRERTFSSYFMNTTKGVAFVQPKIELNAYSAVTPTAAPTPTQAPSAAVKNANYALSEDNTAVYMGPVKKERTGNIPASIKVKGKKYTVTEISAAAFRKNKKIRTVTIGKNVTVIGKEAFRNAKNLEMVTIKSKKLVSIGQRAFKGTGKSLVIRVPKKNYSRYKSLLAKAGFKGKLVKY